MRPRLLLADDSVTIQRVIELTFADENVEVLAVGDGKEAIARVESNPPDIVLADVGMPERNGYEVAEFIKRDPRFAHIPVLLLTGAFEPVDDGRARAIGCDGVLIKPFEPQMVITRVRELLKKPGNGDVAPSTPPAVSSGPTELVAESPEPPSYSSDALAGPDTLEDYFDRLDAALANLGASGSAGPAAAAEVSTGSQDRPHHAEVPAASVPGGAARPVGARPAGPSPASIPATALQTPGAPPEDVMHSPAGPVPLHAAFAALLAAERGEPVNIPLPVPEPLSEQTLEEIVTRVVARMGDEKMRTLVLDAAERLVREEIDRIKSQT